MSQIITLEGTPVDIDLLESIRDNGWSISQGYAIHSSCNDGFIINNSIPIEAGKSYTIEYTIDSYSSGKVYASLGGVQGGEYNGSGTISEVITANDNTSLRFYSDGNLRLSAVKISHGDTDGITIAYRENDRKWVGYYPFNPDFMTSINNRFITFKNGTLWVHNTNEIAGSFYGIKYPSIITFYVNIEYSKEKDFYTMYINGNSGWNIDIMVPPTIGKIKGQKSRIKSGNFKFYKGLFIADFMRDMNDERYQSEIQALFKGLPLQGNIMKITMTSNSEKSIELLNVGVDCSIK